MRDIGGSAARAYPGDVCVDSTSAGPAVAATSAAAAAATAASAPAAAAAATAAATSAATAAAAAAAAAPAATDAAYVPGGLVARAGRGRGCGVCRLASGRRCWPCSDQCSS